MVILRNLVLRITHITADNIENTFSNTLAFTARIFLVQAQVYQEL